MTARFDGLSHEKMFSGHTLPRLQSFFLTNAAGAAFRPLVQWIVDQVLTHLSFSVQELSASTFWRPWNGNEWPSKVIYYHNNTREGSPSCDYTHHSPHRLKTRHLRMPTLGRPEGGRVPRPIPSCPTQRWTGCVSCMVNMCPPSFHHLISSALLHLQGSHTF